MPRSVQQLKSWLKCPIFITGVEPPCLEKPDKAIHRRVAQIMFDTDLIAVRVMLAVGEFFWAVGLLWPGELFGPSRQTYALMANIMSEESWGILFLISSATQLGIVLIGDFGSRFARCFAAWNACLWMFSIAAAILSVYPPPAAMGGEGALALGALWVALRPHLIDTWERKVDCTL